MGKGWSYVTWQPSWLSNGHLWQTKGQIGGGNESGWGKKQHIKMPLCYLLPYDKDSVGGWIGNTSETFPGHRKLFFAAAQRNFCVLVNSMCSKPSNINSYG